MPMRRLLLALLTILLVSRPAAAWNIPGHMTVSAVAYLKLEPEVRTRVDALLRQHPDFTKLAAGLMPDDPDFGLKVFMQASAWPDVIRRDSRFWDDTDPRATPTPPLPGFPDMKVHSDWHHRDEGASFDGTPTRPPDTVNALTQIVALRSALGDPAVPANVRAYDLAFLVHLVEDVHQPLHAVSRFSALHPRGDHGAGDFLLDDPEPNLSLHWFWDCSITKDPDPSQAVALAKSLTRQYVRDDRDLSGVDTQAAVLEWLEESAALARFVVYTVGEERTQPPFLKVPDGYRSLAHQVSLHRGVVAGYRLAALLNERLRGS